VTRQESPRNPCFADVESGSTERSNSSLRYEPTRLMADDEYDRNWVLLDWVGSGKRVLEVGCSTGYISRLMADRNCVVTGIEMDVGAAKLARNYCAEVHVLDLNQREWIKMLPEGAFDVIVLGDVLEHLLDPPSVLRQIGELLDVDGSLVISLPNVVHWITRLKILLGRFDYEPTGTLDHTHVRFFTVKTAKKLIEDSGFRILRFHPAIGGRMTGHIRPVWQYLALLAPGLFGFQLMYLAKK